MKKVILICALTLLTAVSAEAKTIRATEMNASLWQRLQAGAAEELVVEFRQGDELPVSFSAEGDLLETSRVGVSYVRVKRNFWLRLENNNVRMSLDGTSFKPIPELLTGSFHAGAGDHDGIANAVNLTLKAMLR